MILLLNRPPEREAALQQFLQDAHTRGSASYHKWLTPEQFGAQFGPADADIQTAAGWLSSHGFQVAKTSKSRQLIEFSGTAGQLREAFHTQIHQYERQRRNALRQRDGCEDSGGVGRAGWRPLADERFPRQAAGKGGGQRSLFARHKKTTPQWTLPNGNQNFYAFAPEDFATQYDLGPLYKAGVNGSGQTIGIINESNVDLSLVADFQKLFGLSSPNPQVVIDGSDPGTERDVSIEAYLDLEEASAVAPGANVNLYIANTNGIFTGDTTNANVVDPLYLAALRAVEDNQASVLSVSFGNCEGFMQQSGNALWSELWQQAAAQGQTVLVSSGDSGSAGCDNANGQWTTEYRSGRERSGFHAMERRRRRHGLLLQRLCDRRRQHGQPLEPDQRRR
jgi:subtilase family serine protease